MPYHITKSQQCPASKPYAVVKDSDGKVMGCHATSSKAGAQLKALQRAQRNEHYDPMPTYHSIMEMMRRGMLLEAKAQLVIAALRRQAVVGEAVMHRAMSVLFAELGERVAGAARAVDIDLSERLREADTTLDLTDLDIQTIERILDAALVNNWKSERMLPRFVGHYGDVMTVAFETLQRHQIPITDRDRIEKQVLKEGGRRLGLIDVRGDTRTALFRSIQAAKAQGLGPFEIARVIEQEVPAGRFVNAGARYRATLIARTETLHAQRFSTIRYYRNSPIVHRLIAYDGDKDDDCARRNGSEFTIDDAELEMATEHPNGTLTFGPVA